jgi:hypothetical protein
MASCLHPGASVPAALLLVLALAGCTGGVEPPAIGTRALTVEPAPTASETIVISQVEQTTAVDAGPDGRVDEIALDRHGSPVVLIVDERGGLSVDWPGSGDARDRGKTRRAADPLSGRVGFSTIAVTPTDDVLVTGYSGDLFAVASLEAVGDVVVTPVAAELRPDQVTGLIAGLAPDGSALYVAYLDVERNAQLIAVDPRSGAVRSRATLRSSVPGQVTPVQIAVSASGERVFVGLDVVTGDGPTATLRRLGADLEELGEVPLVGGREMSRTAQVVAGRDGTAYATLVVGEVGTSAAEIRLVAVPPGSLSATQVAALPNQDEVRALAVDRSGTWAYLGGLAGQPDPLAVTVTPLDLRTGEQRTPVELCARGELSDIVLTSSRGQAMVAGRCLDTQFASELWTLR